MTRTELLLERIGALSGVVFICLLIAGFVMTGDSDHQARTSRPE